MTRVPRSEAFDDVYFSAEDGLAEARHVFLSGNALAERWAVWPRERVFTITETGFGTGLNFLAALKLWRDYDIQGLHYISVEKYPVTRAFIMDHLGQWQADIGEELDEFLSVYPLDLTMGRHNLDLFQGIRLSLIFGDVNEELPKLRLKGVDAWFLDGFKPATNPQMWSQTVFESMARLSTPGASFATFTAAGAVRRGLQDAGFTVHKVKGFGHKRDMSIGVRV